MSCSTVRESLSKLDFFPTNPSWRINKKYYFNTWKSFVGTLCILVVSLLLSYTTIQLMTVEKSNLPKTQVFEKSDNSPPGKYVVALNFVSAADAKSISITVWNNLLQEGRVTRQDSCPAELSSLGGWTACYLVQSTEMPMITDNNLQPTYLQIYAQSDNDVTVYLETFTVSSIIGSSPKQFFAMQCTPGSVYLGQVSKSRVKISDTLAQRENTQAYTGLVYSNFISYSGMPGSPLDIGFYFVSSNPTTSYAMRRTNLFDFLGVFLGWLQLFTMFLYFVFFFINSFNIKLQIARTLFSNPEIATAKVSFLFFLKLVWVYAIDLVKATRYKRWLHERHYLRQQFLCFSAFESMDKEMSIENINRNIGLLKDNIPYQLSKQTTKIDFCFEEDIEVQCTPALQVEENLMSTDRECRKKTRKQYKRHVPLGVRIFRWFDVGALPVEFNLSRVQKSSVLSIVITYAWIAGTIILVCLLGILSRRSLPVLMTSVYNPENTYKLNFTSQPIYLQQPDISIPNSVVSINASLVDDNFVVVRELEVDSGADCPTPLELFDKVGAFLYCLKGTAEVSFSEKSVVSLMITVGYNGFDSGTKLVMYNFDPQGDSIIPSVRGFAASGGDDFCQSYGTNNIENNGKLVGFSIASTGVRNDCSSRFDGTDAVNIYNIVFQTSDVMVMRQQDALNFFNVVQEGWNVSYVFMAFLLYLVTRPYNKRSAFGSVGEQAQLRDVDRVELLDMSNLLLYLRSKEAALPEDRLFYRKQAKLQ